MEETQRQEECTPSGIGKDNELELLEQVQEWHRVGRVLKEMWQ